MKKQLTFTLIALGWFALGSLQVPALADDPWFDKWDRDHDGHWTYNDFRKAHNAYWKRHQEEKRLDDAALRAEWDRRAAAHREWVAKEDVRDFHHW